MNETVNFLSELIFECVINNNYYGKTSASEGPWLISHHSAHGVQKLMFECCSFILFMSSSDSTNRPRVNASQHSFDHFLRAQHTHKSDQLEPNFINMSESQTINNATDQPAASEHSEFIDNSARRNQLNRSKATIMNFKCYQNVLSASSGVPTGERLQPNSQVHLYLTTKTGGSVRIRLSCLRASAEYQSQICRTLHSHVLTAPRSRDHVIITRAPILPSHKTIAYPFIFKRVDDVPETLEDMVGALVYVWDTRSIVRVNLLRRRSSGKAGAGAGADAGRSRKTAGCGGHGGVDGVHGGGSGDE